MSVVSKADKEGGGGGGGGLTSNLRFPTARSHTFFWPGLLGNKSYAFSDCDKKIDTNY